MPADRLLGTLLRALQTYTSQQDTPRLLGTGVSLLTTLNNPLNVTLLTSQLLSAPAIWDHPEGLKTSVQILSVFHSAAQTLLKHETAVQSKLPDKEFEALQLERTLPQNEWIKAVRNGADGRSPRWRHSLVFGGLLLGFGGREQDGLSPAMRVTLENALIHVVCKHLADAHDSDSLGHATVSLVLNHCFPLLSDNARSQLNYDHLLPVLMQTTFRSSEGLRSSYFLGAVDLDIRMSGSQLSWPAQSKSYQQVEAILSGPLVGSLGPLARLIGHTIEQAQRADLVNSALEDIEDFTSTLLMQWRQTRLSQVDPSEEHLFFDLQTKEKTAPTLWKLLQSVLFSNVIIMRSILGRAFGDAHLARNDGSSSFSQYNFVNLAAMDILAAYPHHAEDLVHSVRPTSLGQIPQQPLDRTLDLFFLNMTEHLTTVLSPRTCEELLVAAAKPYLVAGGNNNLLPIFEAAHSVMLAVFSPPQNARLAATQLPGYVDALFKVFPQNLSSRQFRLAYKALLRITSSPSPLSATEPLLSATLLELLYDKARHASAAPLPAHPGAPTTEASLEDPLELSEQAVLTLTLLDTFSQINLDLLEEWLPLAADLIHEVADDELREHCKRHFWRVLSDGEMDPQRSGVCHAWWSTGGGRDLVLFGSAARMGLGDEMSGGLPVEGESKL